MIFFSIFIIYQIIILTVAHNLRIISYNWQSFNSKTQLIESLKNSRDTLCLQETLLNDKNSTYLEKLDNNFITVHVQAVRNLGIFRGVQVEV